MRQTISSKEYISEHKRAVHQGVKYPCGQLSHKASLAVHQRELHEGLKYPCSQCGKQFSQKSNLARHHKSIHKSQWTWNCYKQQGSQAQINLGLVYIRLADKL